MILETYLTVVDVAIVYSFLLHFFRIRYDDVKSEKISYSILQTLYYSLICVLAVIKIFSDDYDPSFDLIISMQLGWYMCGIIIDFNKTEMLVHHFITIALLLYSQYTSAENFAVAICLVHDVSDPFLHIAKLINYSERCLILRDIVFGVFASVFMLTRLVIFPRIIWYYFESHGATVGFYGLCALQVLHINWSWQILKIIKKVIRGENVKED